MPSDKKIAERVRELADAGQVAALGILADLAPPPPPPAPAPPPLPKWRVTYHSYDELPKVVVVEAKTEKAARASVGDNITVTSIVAA